MPRMKQVEAAIGEADAETAPRQRASCSSSVGAVEHDLLLGRERRMRQQPDRSSEAETAAVPRLPTTIEAAALAARVASSNPAPSRQ